MHLKVANRGYASEMATHSRFVASIVFVSQCSVSFNGISRLVRYE